MAVENNNKPRVNNIFGNIARIVAIVLLITLMTVGISFYVATNVMGSANKKAEDTTKAYVTHPAGEFLTNLSDKGYIKFSMVYLLTSKETEAEINLKDSEIRDKILSILRAKRFSEVRDSKGMETLREDIKASINGILVSGKIQDIYFTSILVN
jgi:flagellar FliL protein